MESNIFSPFYLVFYDNHEKTIQMKDNARGGKRPAGRIAAETAGTSGREETALRISPCAMEKRSPFIIIRIHPVIVFFAVPDKNAIL
jgi:hypothetical protein